MKLKINAGKFALILIALIVIGGAGAGYFKQSSELRSGDAAQAATTGEIVIDKALLQHTKTDLVIGDAAAPVTIVEYSSLSCPHCAHFHTDVLPALQKEFITIGKVKLVVRPFPLNEPALKGAQLVECAGNTGLERANFIKVLFDLQAQWAFADNFLADLKRIALVGGLDSAAFESCMTDKDTETRILITRQEAAEKLGVTSTPSFFVNGEKLAGSPTIESFRAAIAATASTPH